MNVLEYLGDQPDDDALTLRQHRQRVAKAKSDLKATEKRAEKLVHAAQEDLRIARRDLEFRRGWLGGQQASECEAHGGQQASECDAYGAAFRPVKWRTAAGSTVTEYRPGRFDLDWDWVEEASACCDCKPQPVPIDGDLTWSCDECGGGSAKLERVGVEP